MTAPLSRNRGKPRGHRPRLQLKDHMDFTGERYVPSVEGQLKYEHLHRYALSLGYVTGKSVLDIASGEGYGAALLASKADSVTGVDIDPQSVENAKRTYCDPKLKFLLGRCEQIPLADASVDVVTSFETIEHHDKHQEMLNEIKRVLKPGGVLIISSPNRLTYSDEPGYTNPFHVKELYYDEFYELLRVRFTHVRIYGQRLATASFVSPLSGSVKSNLQTWSGDVHEMRPEMSALPSPIYFVAVCSDSAEIHQREDSSVYFDSSSDLFKMFEAQRQAVEAEKADSVGRMQEQVRLTEETLANARFEYEAQLRRQRDELIETRSRYRITLRQREKMISELREQLRAFDESARAQSETQQAWLSEARDQMSQHAAMLDWLYTSSAWRVSPFVKDMERWSDRWSRVQNRVRPPSGKDVFHGVLDYPKSEIPAGARIEVYGWVYSRAAPVRLIQAFIDRLYLGIVRYGIDRPDVAAAFPAEAPLKSGYKERFWLNGLGVEGEKALRIIVHDEKGNKQVYTRAITIEPSTIAPPSMHPVPAVHAAAGSAMNGQPAQAKSGVLGQIESVIADFQQQAWRDPSMLDWNSGLNLEDSFRNLPACTFKSTDDALPHFDHTIDIVVVPSSKPECLGEARRVAGSAVIRVHPEADAQPDAIDVEWLNADARGRALPSTSIIIPVYNNAGHTQNCLEQLIRTLPHSFRGEIIVVDDASSDETASLLERWSTADGRIKVIRNSENVGFVQTCNRGAQAASGEILLFLNNDTLPSPGWLPPLLKTLRDKPNAGAVGGKLIYPDGTLQEAGGIIFSDGSGCNFGKYDRAADSPLYNFVREVDYCSGALLATRRDLFIELGGFDTRFAPAYYEDADYCFNLRAHGYRVYYQPESVIVHLEGASCGVDASSGVKRYQEINRTKFVEKWTADLQQQPSAPGRYDLTALQSLSIRR
jgi:GT2 family glycosyltransferase/ubiquinone/menaquinone biosynthesis C-methylase UbiE